MFVDYLSENNEQNEWLVNVSRSWINVSFDCIMTNIKVIENIVFKSGMIKWHKMMIDFFF